MKRLVIVDGHHLIYRAFHALPPLTSRTGEPTNATFGFASMLFNIFEIEKPTHFVVVFDHREKTFRHEKDETYKATRAPMPDLLRPQVPRCIEVVEKLKIPMFSIAGFEGDDVIGAIAIRVRDANPDTEVVIVTGDRDAFQLIGERISVAIPHKGHREPEHFNPEKVFATFGVHPWQIPHYKALTGDSSDNIRGVDGIGPKGAAELLQKYGTIAGIYDHLAEISMKMREKLEKDRESAFHSLDMATLHLDIPLADFSFDACEEHKFDGEDAEKLFEELQFYTLLARLKRRKQMNGNGEEGPSFALQKQQPVIPQKPQEDEQMSLF